MSRFYYGGQAVVEGVMMRGRQQACVAVRRKTGELTFRSEMLPRTLYDNRIARLPFVRGLVMLWEMLVLGTRMMLFSAGVQAGASEEAGIPRAVTGVMLAVSLTFVIVVFFLAPLLVTRASVSSGHGSLAGNLFEGAIRLVLFLGYLAAVGRLSTMQRVFQYHGAEHKAINAFEDGAELRPEVVQRYSLVHVRCGTAFILWVLVLSVLVFSLLGHPPFLLQVLSRVVFVPVIAAVSYELLRLGARFYGNPVVRLVLQPGLWLQRMTTRQPSDDQVAVAIAALERVLTADGVLPGTLPAAAHAIPAGS